MAIRKEVGDMSDENPVSNEGLPDSGAPETPSAAEPATEVVGKDSDGSPGSQESGREFGCQQAISIQALLDSRAELDPTIEQGPQIRDQATESSRSTHTEESDACSSQSQSSTEPATD